MEKKYLIIDRQKCIGCGACVVASDGRCEFVNGKAWPQKEIFSDAQDIIDVCPVEAISLDTEAKYDELNKKI